MTISALPLRAPAAGHPEPAADRPPIAQRAVWVPLALFLLTMALLPTPLPAGLLVLDPVGWAAVAATAALVLLWRRPPVWSPIILGAVVLLAGLLLAALDSVVPFQSLRQISLVLLGVALLASAVQAAASPAGLRWLKRAWLVGFAIAVAPELQVPSMSAVEQGGGVVRDRLSGLLGQPNYLGELCLLTLFLAFALFLDARSRWDRALAVAGGTLAMVTMALSLSRGSFIGLGIGLLVLVVLYRRALPAVTAGLTAAMAALVIAASLGEKFSSLLLLRIQSLGEAETNPTDARELIWGEAVRLWQANPWTGVGLAGYRASTMEAGSLLAPQGAWHAHNVVLNALAETGLIGLIALVLAAITVLLVSLQTIRLPAAGAARKGAVAALLAGTFAAAAHGAVDFVYSQPLLLSLLGVYVGILAAHCAAARRRP